MYKLLVVGDTHANPYAPQRIAYGVDHYDADAVLIVGDFGWWPQTARSESFMEQLASLRVPVRFIDGNHENHVQLDHDAAEPIELRPNVSYIPRGYVEEIEGVTVGYLGGAFSPDYEQRRDGYDWFEELEQPTREQAGRLGSGVDILFSHDVPLGSEPETPWRLYPWVEKRTRSTREVLANVNAYVYMHGHWHIAHETTHRLNGAEVHGLGSVDSGSKDWGALVFMGGGDWRISRFGGGPKVTG